MPPLSAPRKRRLRGGEVSDRKRLNQGVPSGADVPNEQKFNAEEPHGPQWIYIAIKETHGPWLPHTYHVIEAYATIQEANRGLKTLQRTNRIINDRDWEHWKEKYDTNRCLILSGDAREGHQIKLRVRRVPMRAVTSTTPPPEVGASEGEGEDVENDDDDSDEPPSSEESSEEEEDYDKYASIKQAQRRGGRPKNCRGCGCGEPLCRACWPQTKEEWEAFP